MAGEILLSLEEKIGRRDGFVALSARIAKRFPELQFFFQPAGYRQQVLNFGQPALDRTLRVAGTDSNKDLRVARIGRGREIRSQAGGFPCLPGSGRAAFRSKSIARRSTDEPGESPRTFR